MALLAGSLMAADSSPKDDVKNATATLGSQQNYSWKTIIEFGLLGTSTSLDGKTEKNGFTTLAMSFNNSTTEAVMKGTNAVIRVPDNGWQSAAEALHSAGGSNPAKVLARTAQNFKTPAVMAASLAAQMQDLKAGTNGISGNLTASGAEALLGSNFPTATNRNVSVTFWITNGQLVKYQWRASGTVKLNGSNREMNRTATTEIKDVNTTKIDVAEDAKKKLP